MKRSTFQAVLWVAALFRLAAHSGVGLAAATFLAIGVTVSAQTLPDSIARDYPYFPTRFQRADAKGEQDAAIQVASMLLDRRAMAAYRDEFGAQHQLEGRDRLLEWAKGQFAGDYAGVPIYWDPGAPRVAVAEHVNPTGKWAASIRMAEKGPAQRPFSFEQLWFHCAYELISLSYWRRWAELDERVLRGRIDREDYVEESARIEFAALVDTSKFYATIWTAWAREHHFPTNSRIWRITTLTSFEEWRSGFQDREGYPWRPFGTYYDHRVAARPREP